MSSFFPVQLNNWTTELKHKGNNQSFNILGEIMSCIFLQKSAEMKTEQEFFIL